LAILNEGVRTRGELAELIGVPLDKIKYHIKELLDEGSIEIAYTKPVRNLMQHFYRAVEMPFYTDEEVAAMPPEARQAMAGVALQSIMSEALAAFWAGKMAHDPRLWLSWRRINVDTQGRAETADEQARSWRRIQEIEAESTNRCAKSGERTKSIIVSSLGHLRCRQVPVGTDAGDRNEGGTSGHVLGLPGRTHPGAP
jgi:hypothetical protein